MKGRTLIRTIGTLAVAIAATAGTASAQFRLNFVGSAGFSAQPGSGGSNVLINFLNPVLAVPMTTFPGITEFNTTGTINDVVASTAGCVSCTVDPFLQIGGYTFTLTSTPLPPAGPNNFGPLQLTTSATGTTVSLSVLGNVTGGAFGVTTVGYSGLFTAQFTGDKPADVRTAMTGSGTRFVGFSAEFLTGGTVITTATPEPSAVLLMGSGLAALLFVGLRGKRHEV